MKQAVIIKPYNPKLPSYFKKEKLFLIKKLGNKFDIYHIGSSAVPGLGGKNVIDIILLSPTKKKAIQLIKKLESIGYFYDSGAGDNYRIFLRRQIPNTKEKSHIHLMWKTRKKYKDCLLFRDYLKEHPDEAKKYYKLKKIWAKKAGAIRHKFPQMKTSYVKEVLKKANS